VDDRARAQDEICNAPRFRLVGSLRNGPPGRPRRTGRDGRALPAPSDRLNGDAEQVRWSRQPGWNRGSRR